MARNRAFSFSQAAHRAFVLLLALRPARFVFLDPSVDGELGKLEGSPGVDAVALFGLLAVTVMLLRRRR